MSQISMFTFAAGFIHYCIWMSAFNHVLTSRFSHKQTLLLELLWYPAIYFLQVVLLPYLSILRSLGGLLTLGVPAIFLFREKLGRRFLVLVIILATTLLMELTLSFVLPAQIIEEGLAAQPLITQIYQQTLYSFALGITMFVVSQLLRRTNGDLSRRELLLFILFPGSQLVLLAACMHFTLLSKNSGYFTFLEFAFGLCIVADAAMFYLLKAAAQRARLQTENTLLARQIDIQNNHAADLAAQYEGIRHMRHDIDSHLHTIRILLEQGQTEEAARYAEDLRRQRNHQLALGYCKHYVADAFLTHRICELQSQGIAVTADISLPAELAISNADIIRALSNLLDNAAEACRPLAHKTLLLRVYMSKGYVILETENPVSTPSTDLKKRRIPNLERGVGFLILEELAKQYDGHFTWRSENGTFFASLAMKGDL